MEITYSLIQPLIESEEWSDNKVRIAFKAPNQVMPVEVLGYAMHDADGRTDAQNPSRMIKEINLTDDIKQKTILNTFKTVMCYYNYDGSNWIYSIPKPSQN